MAEAAKVVPGSRRVRPRGAVVAARRDHLGAVDTGEITAEEAPLLVRSLLSAGLDTTIVGIGNAIYAFATNPAQWQRLREKPSAGTAGLRRGAALGIADRHISAPPPAR